LTGAKTNSANESAIPPLVIMPQPVMIGGPDTGGYDNHNIFGLLLTSIDIIKIRWKKLNVQFDWVDSHYII
jgi:hypothetical protein